MMRPIKTWFLLVLATACLCACAAHAKDKPLSWKPVESALLRVDDAPVKEWNVYQTGKKTDRLLLQMGNRFLLIDVHDQRIFEIDQAKVQQKSTELMWNPADCPAQPLATSAWSYRDVGAAFGISAKLDTENRMLDLQLPHPANVGDLPTRSAAPTRRPHY